MSEFVLCFCDEIASESRSKGKGEGSRPFADGSGSLVCTRAGKDSPPVREVTTTYDSHNVPNLSRRQGALTGCNSEG